MSAFWFSSMMGERFLGDVRRLVTCISVIVLFSTFPTTAAAQNFFGVSVGYESFPSAKLKKPIAGIENLEVSTTAWSVGVAFPWEFADGQILSLNRITYRRLGFAYHNQPAGAQLQLTQAQSVQFSCLVIDSLSERWSMITMMTPGLASDFDRSVSWDDFTFQAALGFIRRYGATFQLGFGLAYSRDFGPPIPLPFIYLDWKISPDLGFVGFVPVSFDLRYHLHSMVDVGLAMRVRGDRYHGDPAKYGVNNPQLEYSEATISPSLQIHFAQWIHLNAEGGFAFYRNFEFLDGDISAASYDMEPTGYLRVEFVLGM